MNYIMLFKREFTIAPESFNPFSQVNELHYPRFSDVSKASVEEF